MEALGRMGSSDGERGFCGVVVRWGEETSDLWNPAYAFDAQDSAVTCAYHFGFVGADNGFQAKQQ